MDHYRQATMIFSSAVITVPSSSVQVNEKSPVSSTLTQVKAITAWYWGHEHDCIIYDRHPETGMLGRCIGHGGIPAPRKSIVRNAQTQQRLNGVIVSRGVV